MSGRRRDHRQPEQPGGGHEGEETSNRPLKRHDAKW